MYAVGSYCTNFSVTHLCFYLKPLLNNVSSLAVTSFALEKQADTALSLSSSCLYGVLASSCAVFQYVGLVKMHNTCTNERADMHYVYGFCSVSCSLLLRNTGEVTHISEHLKPYSAF